MAKPACQNSPVLHRLAEDVRQVLLGDFPRRPDEQPLLLHRPVDEVIYVVLAVAELAYPARRSDVLHELDDHIRQSVLVGLLYLLAREQLGDAPVPIGVGRVGEPEGCWGGDDDRPAVRDEAVILRIPGRLVLVLEAGYGVGAGVRDVDPGRAEAYTRERSPEHHSAPRLDVLTVLDGAPQVFAAVFEGLGAPHVRDGVRPLVGGPVVRALGLRAGVVWLGDKGFGGVADYVEPARGRNLGRHRHRQQRVHDAAVATQVLV